MMNRLDINKRIKEFGEKKEAAVEEEDYESAVYYRDLESAWREFLKAAGKQCPVCAAQLEKEETA